MGTPEAPDPASLEQVVEAMCKQRLTLLVGSQAGHASAIAREAAIACAKRLGRPPEARVGHVVVVFGQWHGNPLAALAEAVARAVERATGKPSPEAMRDVRTLAELAAYCSEQCGVALIFVIDRFERNLAAEPLDARNARFTEHLAEAIDTAPAETRFLVVVGKESEAVLVRLTARLTLSPQAPIHLEAGDNSQAAAVGQAEVGAAGHARHDATQAGSAPTAAVEASDEALPEGFSALGEHQLDASLTETMLARREQRKRNTRRGMIAGIALAVAALIAVGLAYLRERSPDPGSLLARPEPPAAQSDAGREADRHTLESLAGSTPATQSTASATPAAPVAPPDNAATAKHGESGNPPIAAQPDAGKPAAPIESKPEPPAGNSATAAAVRAAATAPVGTDASSTSAAAAPAAQSPPASPTAEARDKVAAITRTAEAPATVAATKSDASPNAESPPSLQSSERLAASSTDEKKSASVTSGDGSAKQAEPEKVSSRATADARDTPPTAWRVDAPPGAPVAAELARNVPNPENGPLVFIHIRSESQRAQARDLERRLARLSIVVSGTRIDDAGPLRSDLRYYHAAEADEANYLRSALTRLGVPVSHSSLVKGFDAAAAKRHYELWLAPPGR